jgi:hypothetical protein
MRDFIDVGSQSGPASGMFAPPFIGCVRRLMLAADKGHGKDKMTGIDLYLLRSQTACFEDGASVGDDHMVYSDSSN